MANYKVGDTVVCIDAQRIIGKGKHGYLQAGNKYYVSGFHTCTCGCVCALIDSHRPTEGLCTCNANVPSNAYAAWRFIKLDGLKEDQSETTERIHEQAL